MATKKPAAAEPVVVQDHITIRAPNFKSAIFKIVGTSPYVQHKFSAKAKGMMRDKMIGGSRSKKGKAREARDFQEDYKGAMHISREGWPGIPASSIRSACISACRLVGFKMTLAKLGLFAEGDGFDADEGIPLIKINGKPRVHEGHVRLATGVVDLRVRPMWEKWNADVRLTWDADLFSTTDVLNLLTRVGKQVGLGEGRPDSQQSAGQGWGLFKVDLFNEEKEHVQS